MFTETLDNLIALVLVILTLSLVVQSIQTTIKRLFKIKSFQIQESLVNLFENVLDSKVSNPATGLNLFRNLPLWNLPVLRIFRLHPVKRSQPEVQKIYEAVVAEFQKLGRVTQYGTLILDSLAKEDLMKILEKKSVWPPDPSVKLDDSTKKSIQVWMNTIKAFNSNHLDSTLRSDWDLFKNSLVSFLEKLDRSERVEPSTMLTDLDRFQKRIIEDLAKAKTDTARAADSPELESVIGVLNTIVPEIQTLDPFSLLRARLQIVETWFDTVMQSFDERYTRHMRSLAVFISFATVIVFNANLFEIYSKIANSDLTRKLILQSQETVLKRQLELQKDAADPNSVEDWIKVSTDNISSDAALFSSFGFTPLSWKQVENWLSGKEYWADASDGSTPTNPEVSTSSRARELRRHWTWWSRRRAEVQVLCGWILMTLLLSVGAPFWQDTLESLFGVKNILRQQGSIQNIEKKSGEGNPKQG